MWYYGIAIASESPAKALPAEPPEPGMMAFLPLILMFVVFWFLLIRPQQKKLKEQKKMQSSLNKGEEVITNSGIFGTVTGVADKVITLEVAKDVRIKVLKNQISSTVKRELASS